MIEKIVLNYLKEKIEEKVCMEEEQNMPEEYVLIEKTGSGGDAFIKKATIVVRSYGKTKERSSLLNERVKEAMRKITELDIVTKCSLNSDYNYTETARKKYRYQAVFDITHY